MPPIYPVIMCGGSGTRLWPTSRPGRPKQFIPLIGRHSLFQQTAVRVAPLAEGGRLVVVAGRTHQHLVLDQLAEVGMDATVLLEPEGRDSAAAMAVSALWIDEQNPQAIALFVASDHHIPDHKAFRDAVLVAAEAAQNGRIVTLGIIPTQPSSSYGYIAPKSSGFSDVAAFVEKPDATAALHYIEGGYLWNSGNFIVRADVLRQQIDLHAPTVASACALALSDAIENGGSLLLGSAFLRAPRISIDYAVMEATDRAAVLPVSFSWSDLGSWDAVHDTGEGDAGLYVMEDTRGCLVRASEGMAVVAIGVTGLAIIVERDAVLVTDLARAQTVKKSIEKLRTISPSHLDFSPATPVSLEANAVRLADWLRQAALPVWCTLGQNVDGKFEEMLGLDGRSIDAPQRARVQARQLYVYAEAGLQGWRGPWKTTIDSGLDNLLRRYARPDGLLHPVLAKDGSALNDMASLYDQAFLLLALASVAKAERSAAQEAKASVFRDRIMVQFQSGAGFTETGDHPYQSNAHMHLLEASLAWEGAGRDQVWMSLSDRIVELAHQRFIDPKTQFLYEFFQADWTPSTVPDEALVEPGHQFEWAWLLASHGRSRGDSRSVQAAKMLYKSGLRGVDTHRGVVMDAMNGNGSIRSSRSRLWPQTEWLKASLAMATIDANRPERHVYLAQAAKALDGLWKYLTPRGLWRDKMLPDGSFLDEPAPASSFYHIMAAYAQLMATHREIDLGVGTTLRLD